MVEILEAVGVSIHVEQRHRLAASQLRSRARHPLQDAAGDRSGRRRSTTAGVAGIGDRAKNSVIRSMHCSLSIASGNGTSPRSWIRAADHGSRPNFECMRRLWAETLRTARGPRCWSRSVVPLPDECGTPTRAMSQCSGRDRAGSGTASPVPTSRGCPSCARGRTCRRRPWRLLCVGGGRPMVTQLPAVGKPPGS